MYVDKIE